MLNKKIPGLRGVQYRVPAPPGRAVWSTWLGCVGLTALCATTPPALAQGSSLVLDEVVVTARKRAETIQEVPMAITALDQDLLERIGFSNLTDLAEKVPSLSMAPYPNNSSAMVVFMRGVGTVDSEQIARDPGVGIYLDDVYLGRAQGLAGDLADIERIEVLRGPQGTLYGRNTIGGAIKFLTAGPTGEFGFRQHLSVGNRDNRRSVTRIDLPEAAGVSARLTYLMAHEGGWVNQPGRSADFGERDKEGYRIALRWRPHADVQVDYAHDHATQEGVSFYQQRGGPGLFGGLFTTPLSGSRRGTAIRASELPLRDDFEIDGHALTLQWEVSDQMSLRSVTAYRETEASSVHDTLEAFGIPAAFSSDTDQEQWSQELMLSGFTQRVDLDYSLGLFWFREKASQATRSLQDPFSLVVDPMNPVNVFRPPVMADLLPNPRAEVVNRAQAIYGQVTWTPALMDGRWGLTVGGRYSRDRREIERSFQGMPYDADSARYSSFDPGVTLNFRWSHDIQAYLSRSQGYRTGGFNLRSPAGSDPFDPEDLVTWEAGLKASWSHRVRTNLAVHRGVYDDIQLDFIQPLTNEISTVNAGKARLEGAELESRLLLSESIELGLSYAYLRARRDGEVVNPFSGQVLEDLSMPFSPRHKVHVTGEYRMPRGRLGQPLAWVSYSWEAKQTTNGGPGTALEPKPSYGLLDARVALVDIPVRGEGGLNVAVWGRNLLGKDYLMYRLYGADIYGEPRSYGIDLTFEY